MHNPNANLDPNLNPNAQTLALMSLNDFVISRQVHGLILFIFLTPPMLLINYKLFLVVRKSRRNKQIPHKRNREKRTQLFASGRLFFGAVHSSVCLYWTKNKLVSDIRYFGYQPGANLAAI